MTSRDFSKSGHGLVFIPLASAAPPPTRRALLCLTMDPDETAVGLQPASVQWGQVDFDTRMLDEESGDEGNTVGIGKAQGVDDPINDEWISAGPTGPRRFTRETREEIPNRMSALALAVAAATTAVVAAAPSRVVVEGTA